MTTAPEAPVVRMNERIVWVGSYIITLQNFPPSAHWAIRLIKDHATPVPGAGWARVQEGTPEYKAIAEHLVAHGLLGESNDALRACVKALKNIENDDGRIPASIWKLRNDAILKAGGTL